jgi:hypothetical protein
MTMVRKQIYLEKAQDEELKREAKRLGVSEAALIREGLAQRLEKAHSEGGKATSRLMALIRERHAKLPNGGGTLKFDRESLYER